MSRNTHQQNTDLLQLVTELREESSRADGDDTNLGLLFLATFSGPGLGWTKLASVWGGKQCFDVSG